LRAVIVHDKEDGLTIRGEVRAGDHTIEGEGENFGGATDGRRDGEMMGRVIEEFRIEHGDVGDEFAVKGPCGGHVYAGICGDLREVSAFVCVICRDDPDVGVVCEVGVGSRAVAGEG